MALATKTDAGEQLKLDGKLGVVPLVFDGTVALKGLVLPRFAPYYAAQISFDVRKGTLDLSVPARVAMKGKNLDLVVTGLSTELRDLQLRRPGERDDFLRLPMLAISETNFDLGRQDLVLGAITTLYERPSLRLEIEGHASPTRDLEALRRLELQNRVKAQKVKEVVAGGSDANAGVSRVDFRLQ